jgi:hypothetical protein
VPIVRASLLIRGGMRASPPDKVTRLGRAAPCTGGSACCATRVRCWSFACGGGPACGK